jgi:hypothetical protein
VTWSRFSSRAGGVVAGGPLPGGTAAATMMGASWRSIVFDDPAEVAERQRWI